MKRGLVFGGILVAALAAFELFNFSTTEFALNDVLGAERFLGVRWATILALAFCGIDFAGLARLFTPEKADGDPVEIWYLLGAWFLGATLNAMATWWAVTLALLGHNIGNEVLSREQIITFVPLLVAALVWITRILIIGTFSVAGDRLFSQAEKSVRHLAQPNPLGAAQTAGFAGAQSTVPRPANPARVTPAPAGGVRVGQGQRPQPNTGQRFTRPAPKPSGPPAPPPLAGFVDDDANDGRWATDDLPPFIRQSAAGSGRQANGTNGVKTIE